MQKFFGIQTDSGQKGPAQSNTFLILYFFLTFARRKDTLQSFKFHLSHCGPSVQLGHVSNWSTLRSFRPFAVARTAPGRRPGGEASSWAWATSPRRSASAARRCAWSPTAARRSSVDVWGTVGKTRGMGGRSGFQCSLASRKVVSKSKCLKPSNTSKTLDARFDHFGAKSSLTVF